MKKSILSLSLLLFIFQNPFAQNTFSRSDSWVVQAGVGPGGFSNPALSNNINFATDGLFIEPTFNFSSTTAPTFFASVKKYGKSRGIWSLSAYRTKVKDQQYLRNLTAEEASDIFIVDPSELEIETIGEKKYAEIGLEAAYLWRVLSGSKEKLFINIGPGLSSNFSKQDYYTFDQENISTARTAKSGVNLSLNFIFELNWMFSQNFGVGIEYNASLLDKYLTNNNEFNLDRDDPMNKSFFKPAYTVGKPQVKLMYFFPSKK